MVSRLMLELLRDLTACICQSFSQKDETFHQNHLQNQHYTHNQPQPHPQPSIYPPTQQGQGYGHQHPPVIGSSPGPVVGPYHPSNAGETAHLSPAELERQYDALRAKANKERGAMQHAFDCSSKAYNQHDGAAAKKFSNEGQAHRTNMEAFNAQAAALVFNCASLRLIIRQFSGY